MDLSLSQIETLLKEKLKEKNQLAVDTLRGLKTRITNEQISKGSELTSEEILSLVKSESKRRKEAADSFTAGGRPESAAKELAEAEVLAQFLPEQVSEQEITSFIEDKIASEGWGTADFGKAMGVLKQQYGNSADGSILAKVLKEKLK